MATAMAQAQAPSQNFMASYKQHLDDLEQWQKEIDGWDNGQKAASLIGTECFPCNYICCCCKLGCLSNLPCCGPAQSAGHDINECSLCCCLGFGKAFACVGYEMAARGCEQSKCNPCRRELPVESWSCFQYLMIGAINALSSYVPRGNVYALQFVTTMPFVLDVMRQYGMKTQTVSVINSKKRKVSGCWLEREGVSADKVLLYFCGGAFVLQNEASARWYVSKFANYLGVKTFSANYGKGPQADYFDIIEGAVATWDWLMEQGVKPENVVIGGDSAGGNVAISLALRLRYSEAHRHQMPAGLLLFSPWVNMYPFTSKSYKKNAPFDYIASRAIIDLVVAMYVQHHDPLNPLFSLYRMPEEDLAELPPIFMSAGGGEVLNWSINEFYSKVTKARKHTVADVLVNAPGQPHVYPMMACAHPFPDVEFVPCCCRRSPCLAPCCCCGHCLVASDPEQAKQHSTWGTLENMKVFLQQVFPQS